MNSTIIGVAGTNGSGKDTLMELLRAKYNYFFVSATDLFVEELTRRGEPTDREHKAALSAQWRRESGMGVIVEKAHDAWQQAGGTHAGLVVGSLRHPGEVDTVHELGGIVIWLDADQRLRYDRIQANGTSRGRAAEDAISFEQFQADEAREMSPSGDAATLNMAAVKDRCDVFLDNGGDELPVFQKSVEAALSLESPRL